MTDATRELIGWMLLAIGVVGFGVLVWAGYAGKLQ